ADQHDCAGFYLPAIRHSTIRDAVTGVLIQAEDSHVVPRSMLPLDQMSQLSPSAAISIDTPPSTVPMRVRSLGLVPYAEALAEQLLLHAARVAEEIPDTVLLLQHPHVYTLGRNSDPQHILMSERFLAAQGASVEQNERGGEVTYHGPGQLVAYPIMLL